MWTETHAPARLAEFAGNPTAAEKLAKHSWKKPLLISGPAGVGKSALARAFAREKGMQIVELTPENLESAHSLTQSGSIYGTRKLVVADHAEGFRESKKLEKAISESRNPTVVLTSDLKSKKLSAIKKLCDKVALRRPQAKSVAKVLAGILHKEGVKVEAGVLEKLGEESGGDLRAAINDLETLARGREEIKLADLEVLQARDRKTDMYKVLAKVYGGKELSEVARSTFDLSEQPDTTLLWIDENLPRVYFGRSVLCEAFGALSRADVFLGRIKRRQYWGFLRYASTLMTAGVNAAKPQRLHYSTYQFPRYIATMGRTRKVRSMRKSIAGKLSPVVHASSRVISEQYIPLYRTLLKEKTTTPEELTEQFGFSEDEIEFLKA